MTLRTPALRATLAAGAILALLTAAVGFPGGTPTAVALWTAWAVLGALAVGQARRGR